MKRYKEVISRLLSSTLEDNYAYKQEVMTAVRELVDEVIMYPNEDPQGRNVELYGDIERLFLPPRQGENPLGVETMVPKAIVEPADHFRVFHSAASALFQGPDR